ncbi:hypothetical protein NDU88_003709 [Pleurodeles waltl]|uniref:Uncharacterized protein n=1 Tax=Pleurodeles waltl TaxID=8319 RepID=A0AAV7W2Y0_PLEWA|nr:hypothetical protein NDU88_003709 [Pleurodeles waltl]
MVTKSVYEEQEVRGRRGRDPKNKANPIIQNTEKLDIGLREQEFFIEEEATGAQIHTACLGAIWPDRGNKEQLDLHTVKRKRVYRSGNT